MKRKKRKASLAVTALSAMAMPILFAGCATPTDPPETPVIEQPSNDSQTGPDLSAEETGERDLGGLVITLGNWWGDYSTATSTADAGFDLARLEARRAAEERYNFRVEEVMVGEWGVYQDIMINSILSGDPAATVFFASIPWFAAAQAQNLFAPIDFDFSDRSMVPWMQPLIDAVTIQGQVYGFMHGYLTSPGIFWNLRLFEEAGIDPELPFDLLMAGEWTWAAFEDLLRATTRDVDNDGTIDTWGIAASPGWVLPGFVYGNMAYYVGRNPQTGELYDGSQNPNFIEALNFSINLYNEGLVMTTPPDGAWNWFVDAFVSGQAAMTTGFTWHSPQFLEAGMVDQVGFVPFPMGPQATRHNMSTYYSLFGISHQYADRTNDIMFALSHWWATPEGFEDPDSWMVEILPTFSHPRSVEESIALFNRNQDLLVLELHRFVPNYNAPALFDDNMWESGLDAATIIEQSQLQIQAILADANN